jgi:hypothetical protein
MSADRHLHHYARTLALRSMSPRLIVAILDARIGPFTPGMIGRLSTAAGAPVATIKKAWELKDSVHDVVRPIRRPIAEEPTCGSDGSNSSPALA